MLEKGAKQAGRQIKGAGEKTKLTGHWYFIEKLNVQVFVCNAHNVRFLFEISRLQDSSHNQHSVLRLQKTCSYSMLMSSG